MTSKEKDKNIATSGGKTPISATSASILGRPATQSWTDVAPKRIKPEWQKYHLRLLELRHQLLNRMNGLARESAQEIAAYSLHMADAGTDNFDRDFALSLLSSDQSAIYEIAEAIKRIEEKTYGTCELTGKPIPKARLEAIPWARFTVEAQAQLEREGVLRSRRLGQLGTIEPPRQQEEDGEEVETVEKVLEKDKSAEPSSP